MTEIEKEHWHLDKKVPLSLIFAIIMQTIIAVIYIGDIKKDVEVLKMQYVQQHERDERQDKNVSDSTTQIGTRLDRIDNKLDRLIESNKKR